MLIVAGVLCCIAWKPLGEPNPEVADLILGVVLFIVAGVQGCSNFWQVLLDHQPHLTTRTGLAIGQLLLSLNFSLLKSLFFEMGAYMRSLPKILFRVMLSILVPEARSQPTYVFLRSLRTSDSTNLS